MNVDEQLEFVKEIAIRLESENVPYMLTGSMAMAVYSIPRMTRDIDIVVDCYPEDAERLAELFRADCYVDVESVREAAAERGMFNIIHKEWIIKADFIIRKDEPYRKLELERRRRVDIDGVSICVVAPEDLILSKLRWARDSESELQQRDARQLVQSAVGLDWPYLETWARWLSVGDLLDWARAE
ncbi:MAG: nucleotidyl transferase AbiEii/AbiGii toxin family protein [Candidatus Sumerlaeota bacterium]|nr:nucleotidyl transferase AbiEii/AbiGii toxin family protein [Candidatus Sumerlaeota bacterium]